MMENVATPLFEAEHDSRGYIVVARSKVGLLDPYSMTASVKLSAFLPNAFSSTHCYSSGILIRETQEVHSILNFLREMDL